MNESTLIKKVEKLLRFPPDFEYADVIAILQEFGFKLRNTKGSHNIFILTNPLPDINYGAEMIVVPTVKGRKVKKTYLKKLAKLLDLEVWYYEKQRTSKKN